MVEVLEEKRVFSGRQIRYQHDSKVLNCQMVYSLFMPNIGEDETVPLIWWLSGLTCNDQNFATKGQFQKYAQAHKVAIVIPDTSPRGDAIADDEAFDLGQGASFYLNATQAPWKDHFQMYDYITEELSELVKSQLPQFNGKEAIMGHSMGGYGALMIGLRQPNRFQAISAFAPITDLTNVPWGKKILSAYLGTDQKVWETVDPVKLVQQDSVPPILITQGTADEFYPEQLQEIAFLDAAEKSHATVEYHKVEGYDHSYYTIATFIEEHIDFLSQHLS